MTTMSGASALVSRTIPSTKARPMVGPTCTSLSCTMTYPEARAGSFASGTCTRRTTKPRATCTRPATPTAVAPAAMAAAMTRARRTRRSGSTGSAPNARATARPTSDKTASKNR